MYVATLPFFPLVKQVYDMQTVPVSQQVMMQLYPEIYACIGCNACTKSCTQELNVMQYIGLRSAGDFVRLCRGIFRLRHVRRLLGPVPAGISHPQVAMLARRINGKYLAPKSRHLEQRVQEIENGSFQDLLEALMDKPLEEMQELYNRRDIEK